ncbi:hypothetical protein COCCADRAFT_104077 [Bipolaris zeicola 26-R-13]|uniref:Uncharacterized protein n=1 Tax=Cochliobolus carbonum (strain 26-R-13) TaxID=930089 RepID=W6YGJ3_COCC2|nr:uncharacterized protein COCCADRAFT_104077 [Bipolaris zeicola 26-R-13]EUC30381.1 hypothetical protein COCCADRAFT_104077 [Bipolaris zeicola 26-R-13]
MYLRPYPQTLFLPYPPVPPHRITDLQHIPRSLPSRSPSARHVSQKRDETV